MSKQIVGVFNNEEEAIRVIEQLKSEGYRSEDISVIGKNRGDLDTISSDTGTNVETGAMTGAATGGMVGGVTGLLAGIGALAIPAIGPILAAGPIAATLAGAAVGAGAGGIVGGLIGLGIPEDEARTYDDYVQQGKILVLVESNAERDSRAIETFRTHRSLNESRYPYPEADVSAARDADGPLERAWDKTKETARHAVDSTLDAVDRLDGKIDRNRDRTLEEDGLARRH
ncbi:Heat induced stress protein YflT [Paenibacillus sp. UNCCL117]|uniref:general stress protein n=1 Tax=unclassified Paenibacillus TaxID=185978 RepID=UPI0008900EF3|nr:MULTISPECIES: general stress protein [unclassified Paenibacillus]SDD48669.1 Heat induced stress protein YflT [Paenibacillus sp. cl123]SFW50195.1 Heat induced stress protein YflT [Paenibacillus sp. UNCCL117]